MIAGTAEEHHVLRPGTAQGDAPHMTDTTGTGATAAAHTPAVGARTDWADAVAGLRETRRAEVGSEERDEWAAAADLRVLFAGRDRSGTSGDPRKA